MKTNLFALFLIFSLLSKVAIAADPIVLLNLENEDEYGPFELVNGEVIELEGSEYKVLIEEESEARKALISRLKTTIIETVNFREASFDKVMEFARTIGTGPLNIISILGEFEEDIKFIGVSPRGTFGHIQSIEQLLLEKPAVLEILKSWFLNYKKPGKMVFYGYMSRDESVRLIDSASAKWKTKKKGK